VLFSCKTPQKTSSVIKQQEQTDISNRISLNTENSWYELTEQELRRLINERYRVKISQVIYDTEKPVDSLTQKHPVKEEIDIVIEMNTEMDETGQISLESIRGEKTELAENTEFKSEVQTEIKESKSVGLNDIQKGLIIIGVCSIVGVIVFVVIKLK
jgi:hypothetical protein